MKPVLLDAADVRRLLDLDRLIDVMEETLAVFSSGGARQPVRQALPVTEHGGFFVVMPALLGGAMGAKLVTFYPRNAERGLETHMALVALFDPSTGEPLVVMDGTYLTEKRTAAVSAAATRRLAAEAMPAFSRSSAAAFRRAAISICCHGSAASTKYGSGARPARTSSVSSRRRGTRTPFASSPATAPRPRCAART